MFRILLVVMLLSLCTVTSCGPAVQDPYAVPQNANVEDVLAFIERIEEMQPTTTREVNTHQIKGPVAVRHASDEILSIENDATSAAFRKALLYRVSSIGSDTRQRQRETLEYVKAHLAATANLTGDELAIAESTARSLESSTHRGSKALAAEAYLEFSKVFAGLTPKAVQFEGVHRRLTLVGKPFQFQGVDLAGNEIDMESLKGSVVLFDFWATWCEPCLREIPNVRRNHRKYSSRGFAVVGVSLDQNIALLESFVKTNEIPWPTVAAYKGDTHPSLDRYGVLTIPQMIVVGRDGNVLATDVHGQALSEILARQFR